jgi:hypothetical protein
MLQYKFTTLTEGDISGIAPQKIPMATDEEDAVDDQICYYIFG